MYFLGDTKSSTPDWKSSELGCDCLDPRLTSSVFPNNTRQSKMCLIPSSSAIADSTLFIISNHYQNIYPTNKPKLTSIPMVKAMPLQTTIIVPGKSHK
ncbi:hypothetical protein Hanom_Chr09g00836761 [Helianthus anomalus]